MGLTVTKKKVSLIYKDASSNKYELYPTTTIEQVVGLLDGQGKVSGELFPDWTFSQMDFAGLVGETTESTWAALDNFINATFTSDERTTVTTATSLDDVPASFIKRFKGVFFLTSAAKSFGFVNADGALTTPLGKVILKNSAGYTLTSVAGSPESATLSLTPHDWLLIKTASFSYSTTTNKVITTLTLEKVEGIGQYELASAGYSGLLNKAHFNGVKYIGENHAEVKAHIDSQGSATSLAASDYKVVNSLTINKGHITAHGTLDLAPQINAIAMLQTEVGAKTDAASATGSAFARIKSNADEVARLNTKFNAFRGLRVFATEAAASSGLAVNEVGIVLE